MERLFKHKRAAIQDALGKADSDQDGLLLKEEFVHALEELGIYPGKYDFETLWTQHAESESTPRQLDWKKLVTTFVRFATERYVQQSSGAPIEAAGPSSGLESTRCRSSAGKLTLDCSPVRPEQHTARQGSARAPLHSRQACEEQPSVASNPKATSHKRVDKKSDKKSEKKAERKRAEAKPGIAGGIMHDRTEGMQRVPSGGNEFNRQTPLPPIAADLSCPTMASKKALRRLKEDVLDHSLTLVKELKRLAPCGFCSPETFFDVLARHGVHCSEMEIHHIMGNMSDAASQIKFPLFFQTVAEMKDHHDPDYAGGYFHDGTYEMWREQQAEKASTSGLAGA